MKKNENAFMFWVAITLVDILAIMYFMVPINIISDYALISLVEPDGSVVVTYPETVYYPDTIDTPPCIESDPNECDNPITSTADSASTIGMVGMVVDWTPDISTTPSIMENMIVNVYEPQEGMNIDTLVDGITLTMEMMKRTKEKLAEQKTKIERLSERLDELEEVVNGRVRIYQSTDTITTEHYVPIPNFLDIDREGSGYGSGSVYIDPSELDNIHYYDPDDDPEEEDLWTNDPEFHIQLTPVMPMTLDLLPRTSDTLLILNNDDGTTELIRLVKSFEHVTLLTQ